MDTMNHSGHEQASDPHASHKMSDVSHDRHAGHSVAMFGDKFWLSFALTIPVVLWSTDVQHWFGYTAPSFPARSLSPPPSAQSSSFMAAWSSSARQGANLPITSRE